MTEFVTCYSPIDGSVYARRPVLSALQATDAVRRARSASHAWAARPLAERVALVRDGVARVGAMTDDIVPELAHQMGRPVRYGGEFSGFKERADYMATLAPQALAPVEVADNAQFKRVIKRVPQGVVLVVAVELSLYDGGEHGCSGPVGGQCRFAQGREPNPVDRRTDGAGLCCGRYSRRYFSECVPRPRDDG